MGTIARRESLRAAWGGASAKWLFECSQIARAVLSAGAELGKVKKRDVLRVALQLRCPVRLVKIAIDAGLYGIGETLDDPGITENQHHPKRNPIDEHLSQDPTFRLIGPEKSGSAALTSRLQLFETEMLAEEQNFTGLVRTDWELISKAEAGCAHRVVLDRDSTQILVYRQQE